MVMPQIKDSETFAAAGADRKDGRRPTIVSAPAAASPELLDRPRRRTFTAQDKLRILGEVDRAAGVPGAVGAIVRREGLSSSALSGWRRQRAAGAFDIAALIARRPLPLGEPERLHLIALGADSIAPGRIPARRQRRASVFCVPRSRRSSCAATAKSFMQSCTGKVAIILRCR